MFCSDIRGIPIRDLVKYMVKVFFFSSWGTLVGGTCFFHHCWETQRNTGKRRNKNESGCSSSFLPLWLVRISRVRVWTTQVVLRFKQRMRTTLWTWTASRPCSFFCQSLYAVESINDCERTCSVSGTRGSLWFCLWKQRAPLQQFTEKAKKWKRSCFVLFCVIFFFFTINPSKNKIQINLFLLHQNSHHAFSFGWFYLLIMGLG